MLFLFNKTIKPLDQFAKKIKKKQKLKQVSLLGATADDFFSPFLTKYFPLIFFSVTHKFS